MKKLLKKVLKVGLVGLLALGLTVGAVMAADTADQTVNYEVQAINELNIDDASVTLTVSTATAGAQPDDATDSSTYDITTNAGAAAKMITGALNEALPTGLTLTINMTAPSGATSGGAMPVSNSPVNLVTLIDSVAQADIAIAYSLTATVAAGVVSSTSKTLTLTIVDQV